VGRKWRWDKCVPLLAALTVAAAIGLILPFAAWLLAW
jgi:hypothetical protein